MRATAVFEVSYESCVVKDQLRLSFIPTGIHWVARKSTPMFCIRALFRWRKGFASEAQISHPDWGHMLTLGKEEKKSCTWMILCWSSPGWRRKRRWGCRRRSLRPSVKTTNKLLHLLSRRMDNGIGERTTSSWSLPQCPLLTLSLSLL